jgi:16S rRNA processing protein RimM
MSDPKRLVLVGRVAGAFGVKGEVRIRAYTAEPLALLDYRDLLNAAGEPALTLLSGRAVKDGVIAHAREIGVKEEADALRGLDLYAPRSALPPTEEVEFYLDDLMGLETRGLDGARQGRIKAVHDFGAGDVLEIAPEGGGPTWLVAFTEAAVPEIHIDQGFLVLVRPAEVE